jgi:uncharacterized membrane-anchored protein
VKEEYRPKLVTVSEIKLKELEIKAVLAEQLQESLTKAMTEIHSLTSQLKQEQDEKEAMKRFLNELIMEIVKK